MKKNIIALCLVFATLLTFASCKKLPQDNEIVYESQIYVVDDEGVTHNIKTEYDENGKEIYYYEDPSGNKVTVANKDVVVKTTKVRKTTAVYENQELTPEEQSLLDSFNDPDVFENLVDESLTQPELEISDEPIPEENFEEIEVEIDRDGNPVHDDIEDRITDIVKGEKYTIDTVIKGTDANGEEMIIPLKTIRDGKKMYVETAMPIQGEGSMRLAFLIRDDTCYAIIPGMRAYVQMPAEGIGDMLGNTNFGEITDSDVESKYISTSEVVYNGKKYICDVYESEGSTMKYYYSGNEIKRIEATGPDGAVSIWEINEISDKADSSKLKVPSGYIDMTKLMNQNFSSLSGIVPTTKR